MRQNIPCKFTIEIPLPFSNLNRRRIEQLSETCNRKDIRRIKIKKWCREDIPYMKMIHEIQIEEAEELEEVEETKEVANRTRHALASLLPRRKKKRKRKKFRSHSWKNHPRQ